MTSFASGSDEDSKPESPCSVPGVAWSPGKDVVVTRALRGGSLVVLSREFG